MSWYFAKIPPIATRGVEWRQRLSGAGQFRLAAAGTAARFSPQTVVPAVRALRRWSTN